MLTSKKNVGWLSILFTLFYIWAELTFNLGLVDFLNSKNTEMDTFSQLETFGRILSSVGFALIAYKLIGLAVKKKVALMGIAAVFGIGVYFVQSVVFEKILDDMSPEQSLSAYAFGVYRNLNLNNQVTLNILKGEDKHYDNAINSMLGVLVTNDSVEKNVTKTVRGFFHAENNLDQKLLGNIYDEIQITVPNVDKYWGIYAVESRRFDNYRGLGKNIYRKRFVDEIGLPPSLSKAEFEKALTAKMSAGNELKGVVIIPANDDLKMSALKIGDIPENLNKKQWVAYVNNHVNKALDKMEFKEANVKSLPHSREIISSVVITPIAIILSMLALMLNICSLVINACAFMGKLAIVPGVVTAGLFMWFINSWSYNPYSLNPMLNKLIGSEAKITKMFEGYTAMIHNVAIDDSNPNTYKIIRLEKPKMPDTSKMMKDFDKKMENLKNINVEESAGAKKMDSISQEIKVDMKEFEKNENYYGELNKANPYAK